jgi:hypothetical protein
MSIRQAQPMRRVTPDGARLIWRRQPDNETLVSCLVGSAVRATRYWAPSCRAHRGVVVPSQVVAASRVVPH